TMDFDRSTRARTSDRVRRRSTSEDGRDISWPENAYPSLLADANALETGGRTAAPASARRLRLRGPDAFPRAHGFDDDVDTGQRAVDLPLHVADLGLEELLHVLQFRSQALKFADRIRGQPGDRGVDPFSADLQRIGRFRLLLRFRFAGLCRQSQFRR